MVKLARIERVDPPNPEWNEIVRQGLRTYNRQAVGSRHFQEFSILLRDEQGQIVGGVLGGDIWRWMLVETTWVDEDFRGQGFGTQLLAEAEQLAHERDCDWIILETFSFQALPFYLKQGYVIYGQLDQFPAAHTRYSLKKDLRNSATLSPPNMETPYRVATNLDGALYQILLDLLNRRDLNDLLQRIVDHAASFLDAPYGEIMLHQGEELVVLAFTRNQPYLLGDRVKRGEALVSWLAFDSHQPILIDDYFEWSGKRVIYDESQLQAVADFPVVHGDTCLGVLAMGRTQVNYPFSPQDAQRGMQLAQLIALVIDNITQRHALEQAREQAEEASRVKSQFLASMSHELRTPLNAILGYTGILMEGMAGELDDTARTMLGRVEENGRGLLGMINDMLDLAKIEAGHLELRLEAFDPHDLAKTWYTQTEVWALQKGLAFHLDIPPDFPVTLRGDSKRLSQIVRNLLSNAIKFTERGEVRLALSADENTWQITVTDTGIGIPPEVRDKIFEHFYQVDSSSKRAYNGTGLGLAITRLLCELMAGDILVSSELGVGSRFTVTLPR